MVPIIYVDSPILVSLQKKLGPLFDVKDVV